MARGVPVKRNRGGEDARVVCALNGKAIRKVRAKAKVKMVGQETRKIRQRYTGMSKKR